MDQKWKYDLASLLRVHKPHYVNVTCKGSDNGFVAYQHAITSRFATHQIVWKRFGKPFPCPLTFPIRFCAFDENLCFGPHMTQADLPNIAYLHLYVIDSASVDEYRTSVRHNVSEWFAKVSSKSDVQWLIVVDSTRAKEKKNRAGLMEKLKHDFSKHTSRLIEVSESVEHGSFTGLVQAVQNALLTHLDILTGTWEASLNGSRGKYTDMNWNLSAYCSSTMEYARLYWSLGALEHAMTIYDELDLFLVDIINEMCDVEAGREPRWVVSLRAAGLPFRSLYASFEQAKLDCKKDHGLVAIRHFLLAQQLLLSLHLYNSRHRSRGAAPSMRVDFAALVLRYAKHVLNTAMRQSRIALMNVSPACLACWSLVVSGEALHIAGLLADPSTVDGAAASVCAIQTQRFFSMLELSDVVEAEQSKTRDALLEWLSVEDSSGVTEYLREMLQNPNSFAQQLVKAHDAATSTLLQWGRSRQAAHIGWKMAEWMRANDRDAGALPLELRFITSMLESGMKSQAVVDVMKRVVPFLRDDIDYDRLLAYRLFMAVHESDDDERKKIAEDLMGQISRMKPGEKIK
ncbi:hypothetical protein Y032_0063g3406 [Ancylostoma ceylanicum]|uniref:TRAPPC10/Trs130 N-terminal domain-containing protein n=1 Tax=Ancylostoma ceylanicum TaxID=53326 RepID=A0A016U185_9BILA|nr:hypothetical protein Y032_0063g3406 [Ancylostoma ceylanicum]